MSSSIGIGMVGSIVAKELAAAGYKVVGLERGHARFTVPEFQSPAIHDELRFAVRKALMQDNARETVTFRNQTSQTALPVRRWESFLPGTGLGGSMVHWNGQTYRFHANDFQLATRTRERYGKEFSRCRSHHPGLGRHLRRTRTALRSLRVPARDQRQGRKYPGPAFSPAAIRMNRLALARLPDPAAEGTFSGRDVP